jgi:hypothetical protein
MFESEQIMEGCDLLDKFRSATTGDSMLRKIPGLSILGSVGVTSEFEQAASRSSKALFYKRGVFEANRTDSRGLLQS